MLIAALATISLMADSPIDRVYDYYSRANTMAVTISLGIQGKAPYLQARYGWVWPDRQIQVMTSTADKLEFWQDKNYARVVDRGAKNYAEYPSPGKLTNPPDDFPDLYLTSPMFLLMVKSDTGRKTPFKVLGKKSVDGQEYDYLQTVPGPGEDPSGKTGFYVDGFGRVVRVEFTEMSMSGPVAKYFAYTNYDMSPGAVKVPSEVPSGFMPMVKPDMYFPPMAGGSAKLTTLTDARSNASVDLKKDWKGKRVAILVTSPDCVPSAKGEAAWKKLREALTKESCGMIEIVVDSGSGPLKGLDQKDPKRPVYLDTKGEFSKLMQPPVTPYIFLVGKSGYVLHAWAGYAPDQDARLVKSLTEAWDGAPEGF